MPEPRLQPVGRQLFVVRWIRLDGRNARHRYYYRRHDALAFAGRLAGFGRPVAIYRTAVSWDEVPADE